MVGTCHIVVYITVTSYSVPWRLNHQPNDCLLNRLFRRRSKKTWKRRVTWPCEGNWPVTGEFPAQRASYAENTSTWWRHRDSRGQTCPTCLCSEDIFMIISQQNEFSKNHVVFFLSWFVVSFRVDSCDTGTSINSEWLPGLISITWINFNPSMDK